MQPHHVQCATCPQKALTLLALPDGWVLVSGRPRCRRCQVLLRLFQGQGA